MKKLTISKQFASLLLALALALSPILTAGAPTAKADDFLIPDDDADITSAFTDPNFLERVQTLIGKQTILYGDVKGIQQLSLSINSIYSLAGIEYFTALTTLYCDNNNLTSLDVSKNTALTNLYCERNNLTSLDVSGATALRYLYCERNNLTSLDVSKNTALTELHCFNNQLTSLDVSGATALRYLSCRENQLTSLDVSKNTALTQLFCEYNQLTSLDVSGATALKFLYCSKNQLASLDVSKNTALTTLYCNYNNLASLDVSKNTALTTLFCNYNYLPSEEAVIGRNKALTSFAFYPQNEIPVDGADFTELNALITSATEELNSAVVGSEVGNYPQSAVDALGAAIAAAQSVADKSDATQAQVDAAVTALQSSVDAFAEEEILVTPPSPSPSDSPPPTLPPIDDNANVGIVRSVTSSTQKAVFVLVADITAKPVNLIEATVNYDPSRFDAYAYAHSTVLSDATVSIVELDEVAGQLKIVVGVDGLNAIGFKELGYLAVLELTPKSGLEPDKAYVELSDYIAYSIGEDVALTAKPANAESTFTYVTTPTLDVNGDGAITAADLSLILYYFGANEFPAGINADVNGDGVVDMLDVTLLVNILYA